MKRCRISLAVGCILFHANAAMRSLRRDATPAANAVRLLRDVGAEVETEYVVEANDRVIGELILSRAADIGADLIVMGAYGHRSPARAYARGCYAHHPCIHDGTGAFCALIDVSEHWTSDETNLFGCNGHGDDITIRAEVARLDTLSAHADANDLLAWLKGFQSAPRQTFIVHGEPQASDALRCRIQRALGWPVIMPDYRETYRLEGAASGALEALKR